MSFFSRIVYVFIGFIFAVLLLSLVLLPSQNFTILDLWKFSISPGIVALIAATIGARAGARSNIKASEEDLALTYWSLLELAKRDIEMNLDIMERVRRVVDTIRSEGRKPVFFELEPESVHTMFFEDIEYPKLRKVVPADCTDDIFHLRNMKYVFERWNHLVQNYYNAEKPLVHDGAETEMIDRLTAGDPERNFIDSCRRALEAVRRITAKMNVPKAFRA